MQKKRQVRICSFRTGMIAGPRGSPTVRRKEVSMGDSAEKTAKPKFIDGLKAEFKKISWPDRQSTFKQSVAVVAISVVLGVIIAVLDYIIQNGVQILTTIGRG